MGYCSAATSWALLLLEKLLGVLRILQRMSLLGAWPENLRALGHQQIDILGDDRTPHIIIDHGQLTVRLGDEFRRVAAPAAWAI